MRCCSWFLILNESISGDDCYFRLHMNGSPEVSVQAKPFERCCSWFLNLRESICRDDCNFREMEESEASSAGREGTDFSEKWSNGGAEKMER